MQRPERRNPPGRAGSEGAFAGRGMRRDRAPSVSRLQRSRGERLEAYVRLAVATILHAPPLTPAEVEVFDWLRAREMERAEARRASPWWRAEHGC